MTHRLILTLCAILGLGLAQAQFTGGPGRGDDMAQVALSVQPSIDLSVRVFLEGPYVPAVGLMNDALRTSGVLPFNEPFTALGYAHIGGGGETVAATVLATSGPQAIVDWVLVELRDVNGPSTILASRSALLCRDGAVVDIDGSSPISFPMPAAEYHIAVRHRNHLGVMTAAPYSLSTTPTVIDLSLASTPVIGTQPRNSVSGTFPAEVLWAGDASFNGTIKYTGADNDRDPILSAIGGSAPTTTLNGYHNEDVNLDGAVRYTGSSNDRDIVLQNVGGSVPTAVRVEQLP